MSLHFPGSGLYAITPEHISANALPQATEQALKGGARVIQFRDKQRNPTERLALAKSLLARCHAYQVPLIINDDISLAEACGADGVHLGREDGSIEEARSLLGPHAIIGASCYGDIELARKAQFQGASYVAFGRCFPSKTKPNASLLDIGVLEQAQGIINLPKVLIGGINADNAASLIESGADLIACVEGVFGGPNIEQNAAKLSQLFPRSNG